MHLALTRVEPEARWSFLARTLRRFEYYRCDGALGLVLDRETSIGACLVRPNAVDRGEGASPTDEVRVLDRGALRDDPAYLGAVVRKLLGGG